MTTLTKEQREKRVAIAQDVLDQLVAEQYVAVAFTYHQLHSYGQSGFAPRPDRWDAMTTEKCRVCAMGAIFVSKLRLLNAAPRDTEPCDFDNHDMERHLVDLFPDIRAIEQRFMRHEASEDDAMTDVMIEIIASDGALVE